MSRSGIRGVRKLWHRRARPVERAPDHRRSGHRAAGPLENGFRVASLHLSSAKARAARRRLPMNGDIDRRHRPSRTQDNFGPIRPRPVKMIRSRDVGRAAQARARLPLARRHRGFLERKRSPGRNSRPTGSQAGNDSVPMESGSCNGRPDGASPVNASTGIRWRGCPRVQSVPPRARPSLRTRAIEIPNRTLVALSRLETAKTYTLNLTGAVTYSASESLAGTTPVRKAKGRGSARPKRQIGHEIEHDGRKSVCRQIIGIPLVSRGFRHLGNRARTEGSTPPARDR